MPVSTWLKSALSSENLDDFSVKLLGKTAKGDGYLGDIIFVKIIGTKNAEKREYDLVLKCSKKSRIMREKVPIKRVFLNEICFYDKVVPVFSKFENERGIKECFSKSVAKFYGTFESDDIEVLVLQNLKEIGYELYDRRKPLTRRHVEFVIKEYAKFHAISGALRDQKKEVFDEILSSSFSTSIFNEFRKVTNFEKLFADGIDSAYDCLQDQIDQEILNKFRNLGNCVKFIFDDMWKERKFSVLVHADCWNNNFMYQYDTDDKSVPSKVAIIDWQLAEISSPIRDLCHFLFACISGEDINDLEAILGLYHDTLSDYLGKLGSDVDKLYPRSLFFEEWKKFAKFGIVMSVSVVRNVIEEDSDAIKDVAEVMENGGDFADTFDVQVKDREKFAARVKYLVEYAAKSDLLSF